MIRKTLAVAALALTGALAACSSGPAQSSLGPFTMTPCKVGWTDGAYDGRFFTSWSAAWTAAGHESPLPASEFSITLNATAVVGSFTVAYYTSTGTEIGTGTASPVGNVQRELTAGQRVTFVDDSLFNGDVPTSPNRVSSCKVVGSDTGNA